METLSEKVFDFEAHKLAAMEEYKKVHPIYDAFATTLKLVVEKRLKTDNIKYHSIEARAKEVEKFGEKAAKPLPENGEVPKYKNPLVDITDLAGVRIIMFFLKTQIDVDKILYDEFTVIEKNDKSDLLDEEEKLGYQSIHYLIKLKETRSSLSEYAPFKGLIAEIQVRTILQHAWAEIEHDIEYKSSNAIPKTIKRRFMALAGMLEMGDREFQSIQDENENIKTTSRNSVDSGKLDVVEITGDSLKLYLDKKYGNDARMSEFSYDYAAGQLIKMGFRNLKQIDECISGYDGDKVSRIIWSNRQGQIQRFNDTVIAALGEDIIYRHPYCTSGSESEFWVNSMKEKLIKLKGQGIVIGKYKFNTAKE